MGHSSSQADEGDMHALPRGTVHFALPYKNINAFDDIVFQAPMNYTVHHRTTHFYYRNEIIGHLDSNYHLLSSICSNVAQYTQRVKAMLSGKE